MIASVKRLDEASQTVRLAFGSSDEGNRNGKILRPAVAMTEATLTALVAMVVLAFGLEVLRSSPSGAGVARGMFVPAFSGGGSALLAVGIPPLPANVTNAVAFVTAWPGSAFGSRPELDGQGPWLRRWAPLAVAGSAVGGRAAACHPG